MRAFYTYILTLFFCSLFAQQHDYNWMMGDGCGLEDPTEGVVIMNFSSSEPILTPMGDIEFEFLSANTSISDSLGNLQFYCNGNDIYNWQHELIENGGNLVEEGECEVQNFQQAVVGFQRPNSDTEYILINIKEEVWFEEGTIISKEIYYNLVDMEGNNGKGSVVIRKELIVEDYLNLGQGMVCQHANGRDWWLLLFKFDSTEYYRFLIDPSGVVDMGINSVDIPVMSGRSQVVFSPNGAYFAQYNTVSTQEGTYIDIFDFDRCTGMLSNQVQLWYDEDAQAGGAVFSPSSRFLYISSFNNVYQYDMWAEDIEASRETVGVYDGYLENGFWASHFHLAQLAPDDKIYITTPVDGHYLHVIHNPDEKGAACDLELRGLEWPTWKNISLPNFPHYRMGALEGSPCDSLSVSVGEVADASAIEIYPNPAVQDIRIKAPKDILTSVQVYTIAGQQLAAHSLYGSQATLDVSAYAEGIYLIEVMTASGQRYWERVVVNK